jgi:hypothetical protein
VSSPSPFQGAQGEERLASTPKSRPHLKFLDGKQRGFLVEGVGGPSWYAEYSVMTGLSARSFGR